MSKTHRADGTPTAYGFACGFGIIRKQEDLSITFFFINGVFEIKSLHWSKYTTEAAQWAEAHGWNDPYDFRKWKTASTVHEARRIFAMECKRLGLRVTP